MQFIRNIVDRSRKLYHPKDSRFHKVWPVFDAFETFLFSPDHRASRKRVHCRDYVDLKRVMNTVILALVPCLLWAIWNTGAQHFAAISSMAAAGDYNLGSYQTGWLQGLLGAPELTGDAGASTFDTIVFGLQRMLPIVVVSYGVGLGIEMLFSIVRSEEVSEGYLVSGMLIALIVPPSTPLWQLAIGIAFAVVLGKEVFGGTGMNIFNVAMMVRAFLFFAFPAQMSGDAVWVAGNTSPTGVPGNLIDGYSEPTALALAKSVSAQAPTGGGDAARTFVDASGQQVESASDYLNATYSQADLFFGNIPGSCGEMSKLLILLGAAIILIAKVASWRTMAGGVVGLLLAAYALPPVFTASGIDYAGTWDLGWQHLICGGFLFGIVFMATDPVSSPETDIGKWIYGALIGVVTILVRTINPAYPEGTMLAILLLNAFAPTIDHFVVQANIKRRMARV